MAYSEAMARLEAKNARLREALEGLVRGIDDWNEAVTDIVGRTHTWPDLEAARALLDKETSDD